METGNVPTGDQQGVAEIAKEQDVPQQDAQRDAGIEIDAQRDAGIEIDAGAEDSTSINLKTTSGTFVLNLDNKTAVEEVIGGDIPIATMRMIANKKGVMTPSEVARATAAKLSMGIMRTFDGNGEGSGGSGLSFGGDGGVTEGSGGGGGGGGDDGVLRTPTKHRDNSVGVGKIKTCTAILDA
jgi:hypothetical protein